MFDSPHYHHFAEKALFFVREFVLRLPQFTNFFSPGITCDTVSMDRHEKREHTGGSVLVFPQNRHVGRVSQTTKKYMNTKG